MLSSCPAYDFLSDNMSLRIYGFGLHVCWTVYSSEFRQPGAFHVKCNSATDQNSPTNEGHENRNVGVKL